MGTIPWSPTLGGRTTKARLERRDTSVEISNSFAGASIGLIKLQANRSFGLGRLVSFAQ